MYPKNRGITNLHAQNGIKHNPEKAILTGQQQLKGMERISQEQNTYKKKNHMCKKETLGRT